MKKFLQMYTNSNHIVRLTSDMHFDKFSFEFYAERSDLLICDAFVRA